MLKLVVAYTRGIIAKLKECSIEACGKRHYGKGFCRYHWERVYRGRDLDAEFGQRSGTVDRTKFFNQAAASTDRDNCVFWPFTRNKDGRGTWHRNPLFSHSNVAKAICEMVHGPAPQTHFHAAHECGNGHLGCINPNHLSWQSPQKNAQGPRRNKKLITEDVTMIRSRHLLGESAYSLSKEFGVTYTMAKYIVSGHRWKETSA